MKLLINFIIEKFYDKKEILEKINREIKRIMFDNNYKYYANINRLRLLEFLENLLI